MRNIHTTINEYYDTFESYAGVVSLRAKWFWCFIFALILSFFSMVSMLGLIQVDWYIANRKFLFIVFILSFFVTLFCLAKLSLNKDAAAVKRSQEYLGTSEGRLWKLKSMWLKKCLPYKQSEYLDIADMIDKTLIYRERYRDLTDLRIKDFGDCVFADESKPRILAMFLMLCATVATLSIKEGATLTGILEFYGQASLTEILIIFIVAPTVIFVAYLEAKFVVVGIARLMERILERLNGKNAFSRRRARVFVNVLVQHVSFEKPRLKVFHL